MSNTIEIQPRGRLRASVRPPGSKSITNRALICAALADGTSNLHGALKSEDTQVMIDALRALGVAVQVDSITRSLHVTGCNGKIPAKKGDLYAANSGTTVRFLTALLTLAHGRFRLHGTARMHERPIFDLLHALSGLGADVKSEFENGCPPVIIKADGLRGGDASVAGDVSSQFLSGLLMAAPYADKPIMLSVKGELVSRPYVHMTLAVMKAFGVKVPAGDLTKFTIPNTERYRARDYEIEPDASAASYFFAAAAIAGGSVTVEGLSRESLQGDLAFLQVLSRMGCHIEHGADTITVVGGELSGIEMDMNSISDTVPTLAAVALFAKGPTTITGVGHIRHKESDRIGDLACELRKVGAKVDVLPDGLRITPQRLSAAGIDTYADHRMAMSLALVGLKVPGIVIRDPDCTAKTYPDFFADLEGLEEGA